MRVLDRLVSSLAYSAGKALVKEGIGYLKSMEEDDEALQKLPSNCLKYWLKGFKNNPAGVHLVIGKQRSGKTALCYTLAQFTQRQPIHIITTASKLLASTKPISAIDQVPRSGVCIIDDASYFYASQKKSGDTNFDILRELIIFAEKMDICFIFNTHDSTLLNKHVLGQCKSLIFKQPNLFGIETERKMVKVLLENIQKRFEQIPVPQRSHWFFLYSSDCKAWGKNALPQGWNNQVSTSIGNITNAEYKVIDDTKHDAKHQSKDDVVIELKRKEKEKKEKEKDKKLLIRYGYCPECRSKDVRIYETYGQCLVCGAKWE